MALRKLAAGLATLTIARVLQVALSFLAIPILARLIDPAEFGIVALATPFVLLAISLSEVGFGQSLVSVDRKDRETWSSAFWLITAIGLSLSIGLAALAWPISWLFGEPRLLPVVFAFAIFPFLQATVTPSIADLQQRERFSSLAAAETSGAIAGAVAAIVLAYLAAGTWALVAQQLAYWAVRTPLLLISSGFRPKLVFSSSNIEEHLRFGRDTVLANLIGFFSRQIDPLVIGKILGPSPVGLYTMSYRLMLLPAQLLSNPVQSALFTKMVYLKNDISGLRDLLLASARALATVIFPPMALVAAASAAYFHVLLSAKWIPAAPLFTMLAATGAMQSVTVLIGTLLMATGRTGVKLRLNAEFALIWVVALPLLALIGVEAVALGYTVVYALCSLRSYRLFLAPVRCSVSAFMYNLRSPILVSIAAVLCHLSLNHFLQLNALQEVILTGGELVCAYGLLLSISWRGLLENAGVVRAVIHRAQMHAEGAG